MSNSLQKYLEAAEGAGKVLAHARLLVRLAGIYREMTPSHLADASSVANYKSRVLVIHADSSAVATKLRQMAPTLATELMKRGLECSGIQVKVHARQDHQPTRGPTQKPLSARTSRELAALSESLPASPLRHALENLLTHSAKRE
ncbi:MAG: DUF721 domain-containing protein [Candidatus Accumulibacter sp.]|uniref:DUF721 domain-containing protein n=1 Tax=Candidatus Accumulibacter proximus TaxID=2954385 RepID=A0A935PY44_9PROT|nr:DUF721 domain-containing protein [Candidatus Accumulibacter proximus]